MIAFISLLVKAIRDIFLDCDVCPKDELTAEKKDEVVVAPACSETLYIKGAGTFFGSPPYPKNRGEPMGPPLKRYMG